jgi:ABC-2 type transport system ATP-binding protein
VLGCSGARRLIPTRGTIFEEQHPVLIETEGLTKRFGSLTAVDSLTIRVDEGEVFGFLGPNGAGKTTTMRMLSCLVSKSSGTATVAGCDIGRPSDAERIRSMIGVLPESAGLYDDLSARRNIEYYGRIQGLSQQKRDANIERLLKRLGLWDKRDESTGTFSKGMKQKVAIARALVHDPKVVFLDEPTANLDPESSKTIRDVILELKRDGKTVFFNTHNLDEAQRVCDRVGVIKGRLLAVDSPGRLGNAVTARRTAFTLEKLDAAILAAVRRSSGGNVETDGDTLYVGVEDPVRENPEIVQAVIEAGGRVVYVTDLSPSLEAAYLKLVEEHS